MAGGQWLRDAQGWVRESVSGVRKVAAGASLLGESTGGVQSLQDVLAVYKRQSVVTEGRYINLVVYYVVKHEQDLEMEDGSA